MSVEFSLNNEEKKILGQLVQLSIISKFENKEIQTPEIQSKTLHEHLGCFITLNINGHLRGCIGSMVGHEPLFQNVVRMAQAAAFSDYRFKPLTVAEWENVDIEISVLGPLTLCPDVNAVEIGKHGLLLSLGQKSGVFLPKVPVEQGWNLQQYLDNLCLKASLPKNSWQNPQAQLYWYEALVFAVEKSCL